MDYSKNDGNRILSNLRQREIYGLLKCQIPMTLKFTRKNKFEVINLGQRTLVDNIQMIEVSDDSHHAEEMIQYADLISRIQKKMKFGELTIEIALSISTQKESLIVIAGNIKTKLIDSCVYIDYDDGLFSLINKPLKNGISDKLYFFEKNSSILFFGENGPKILYDSPYNNVEDLLC